MDGRETAGITIRLIIDYVRAQGGDEAVGQLRALAGETRSQEQLQNPRVWSSYESALRIWDAAAKVTGDPEVALRVGETAATSLEHPVLRSMFTRFGSVKALLRALPLVHSKFDTAIDAKLLDLKSDRAAIEFQTRPGYEVSRHCCLYTQGLLTQAPVLYGLPPAVVLHDCCLDSGSKACRFEMTWLRRSRVQSGPVDGFGLWHRARATTQPASFYRSHLDELQQTLLELMETRDVDEVLRRVTTRAGGAVAPQRLLFAARPYAHAALRVYADGIDEAEALRLADDVLNGRPPVLRFGPTAAHVIQAEVRSPERDYGKIVAFSDAQFETEEVEQLRAYARLAATTLDAVFALEAARDRQASAEALGSFARRLIDVKDLPELATATVEAVRAVSDADMAVIFRYEEDEGCLRSLAHDGFEPGLREVIDSFVVRPDDTPLLEQIVAFPVGPVYYSADHPDPYVRRMFEFFGLHTVAVLAVHSEQRLFGLYFACWQADRQSRSSTDTELLGRLGAVADQAAGAWEKTRLLEQVRHQATIDALTGLSNRRAFTEMLGATLARAGGTKLAVLFCDLDRFKGVNDALGHAAGDELLIQVGRRLQHCVRSDDLVARLGGDEFTVLLSDVEGEETLETFSARVRQEMSEPIEIEGSEIVVRLSIGAVVTSSGAASVKDVLRRADAAMYVAKARGGDRLLIFEEAMLVQRSERVALEASLAAAANDLVQFAVLYQPQVNLDTSQVIGAEALVRWDHPTLGRLAPDRFLPLAEETGLVVPLDFHVLRTALAQAAAWRAAGVELRVAVNFSARTLVTPDLVSLVKHELARADLPGALLEIELTESAAVTDTSDLSEKLLQLGDLGISISIDDVGTGYSSLALLHRLPAQRIKIDRSFVSRITEDRASRSVVEAVLLLADRLGQGTVAEGIETRDQADELRRLGCLVGQGYLYSPPVEADELARLATRTQDSVT